MLNLYLYLNAVIFLALSAWCTLASAQTAKAIGYDGLSRSGISEYLVVYGGLQLGLGLFFLYCARAGQQHVGLIFALAIFGPLASYRVVTVARQWPVATTTLCTALLEIVLMVGAIALWWHTRS